MVPPLKVEPTNIPMAKSMFLNPNDKQEEEDEEEDPGVLKLEDPEDQVPP